MGLYDRDYTQYQDSEPRFGSGLADKPVWLILLVINVALFLINGILFTKSNALTNQLALTDATLYEPWNWWKWLTYGFAHGGINHILFNMIGLYFFGSAVERRVGRGEFLRFYLIAVVVGGLIWSIRVAIVPDLPGGASVIGASGAVTAAVILFCLYYPQATLLLFFVLPIKAWVAGILFVVLDLVGGMTGKDNVAYDVHLAGAAFALIYYLGGWNFGSLLPSRIGSVGAKLRANRPKLRLHDPEKKLQEEAEQADRILQKIHEQGEQSLTSAERKILERYSRRMRQR